MFCGVFCAFFLGGCGGGCGGGGPGVDCFTRDKGVAGSSLT